jgi:Na+/phosphate symporter
MDPYDFSAMRRELAYQEFMIHYLQEEQKKRWEELRDLERNLEKLDDLKQELVKLQNDPKFKKLVELLEKSQSKPVAEQVRVPRRCTKRARRSAVSSNLI